MIDQFFFSQYPVKGRFRGQIDAYVCKLRDNLIRRQIPVLRTIGYFQNLLAFLVSQLVARHLLRALAFINAVSTETPADNGSGTETDYFRSRTKTGSRSRCFVNQIQDYLPFFGGMLSSSSPQIAWTFFFNTNKAAASAKALSLRASSLSSSRIRLASADLPFVFLVEAMF
jgi:hypothetical protein